MDPATVQSLFPLAVGPGETAASPDLDFTVTLRSVGAYSLLIAKQDPGQGIVWLAFGLLLTGLLITFYLPRRRVWARIAPDGELRIVGRADRYVDFEREFGRLLDDLVARRRAPAGWPRPGAVRRPSTTPLTGSRPWPPFGSCGRRSSRRPRPVAAAGPAQLDREVGWVRVLKARVPAFDALEAGDVAIVPASALAVVAPGGVETAALVEALAAGRCAGILLMEADGGVEALAGLGAALSAAGIPALHVGRMDPNQLERSAIGFLVNRRAELEHQAGLLEATSRKWRSAAATCRRLIAAIGGFLGRAVSLEGRRGEVLAVHAPDQAPGAGTAVSAYLAGSRTAALRVALPAPPGGDGKSRSAMRRRAATAPGTHPRAPAASSSAGRLVLLGERPASDLERVVGPRVGRLLALELARADAVRRAQDIGRRTDLLPADGPPWVMLVARQVPGGGTGVSIEAREEIRSRLRIIASPRRLALRGDAESLELRLVLAVPGPPDDHAPSGPNFVPKSRLSLRGEGRRPPRSARGRFTTLRGFDRPSSRGG